MSSSRSEPAAVLPLAVTLPNKPLFAVNLLQYVRQACFLAGSGSLRNPTPLFSVFPIKLPYVTLFLPFGGSDINALYDPFAILNNTEEDRGCHYTSQSETRYHPNLGRKRGLRVAHTIGAAQGGTYISGG